jgi:hypothetical protein
MEKFNFKQLNQIQRYLYMILKVSSLMLEKSLEL